MEKSKKEQKEMISIIQIIEAENPEQQYIRFGNEERPLTTIPSLRGGEIRAMQCDECGGEMTSGQCPDCGYAADSSLTNIYKEVVKEQDEQQTDVPKEFEEHPMEYILSRYKRLNKNLTQLMGEDFKEYIDGIFITSGKPTTFKIHLKNHQYFFMVYMGKGIYEAIVLGKRYYLSNLGDIQRATMAISRILRFGPDLPIKGPESEQGAREEEGGEAPTASEEAPEAPEEEETT
jgi:hypothetical protein